MTIADSVKLLAEIETLIKPLPEPHQGRAIAYLTAAQEESEQKEPDKELAAKNETARRYPENSRRNG